MQRYDIRAERPDQPAASLSGGNQQKVVLARELERDISVLVAAHPTRGLDVGSIEYVHTKLLELKADGRAVVVVTSDLDEAMAVSDVDLRAVPGCDHRRLPPAVLAPRPRRPDGRQVMDAPETAAAAIAPQEPGAEPTPESHQPPVQYPGKRAPSWRRCGPGNPR